MKVLLEYGAGVDKLSVDSGVTPLHVAAENGHTKVMKVINNIISGVCSDVYSQILLDHDAKVDAAEENSGETPLHKAAFYGLLKTAQASSDVLLRSQQVP